MADEPVVLVQWRSTVDGSVIGVPAGSFTDEACKADANYELVTTPSAPKKTTKKSADGE